MDSVNLAAVGLGGWGRNVVRAFSGTDRCQLVAICDTDESTLRAQQPLYPTACPTTDIRSILADETIDAVAIATPAQTHFAMANAALAAGKHVFVEKPLTLTSEESEELIETAERASCKLMVGHLLKYHPAVRMIKQRIDAGEMGEVRYMYTQRLNLGVVRQTENAFWSLAPHDISVILYLFDQEPSKVTASGQSYLQPRIHDVVFCTLHFPDGRIAQIHVSWLDPSKERRMVVVGSQKMLVFDDMEATEKIRIYDKGATVDGVAPAVHVRHGDIHLPHVPQAEPLKLEAQHFVDCILNDTTPLSDGHDGLRVVRILEMVDRQLRQ